MRETQREKEENDDNTAKENSFPSQRGPHGAVEAEPSALPGSEPARAYSGPKHIIWYR